jgi:prophage regulatory protein
MAIIRLPALTARVGLIRSSIYRDIAAGDFPAPIKLGVRSVGWRTEDVDEWVASRPRAEVAGPSPSPHPKVA